jgi:cell division septal protein FtsQ
LLPLLALTIPGWKTRTVEIVPCPGLPECVAQTARSYQGSPAVLLDLDYFRRLAEAWPQIHSVEVHFQLPGTLRIHARPTQPSATVEVAGHWHGVTERGFLCGRRENLIEPTLTGFDHRSRSLRQALAVANRLEDSTGWQATEVRRILPGDLEVELRTARNHDRTVTARLSLSPTTAERWWLQLARTGQERWGRVDLRRNDRIVVGEAP